MRLFPVAAGVLKHQLYVRLSERTQVNGRDVNAEDAVLTFWTWKAGGSPVAGARVAAEIAGILTWIQRADTRAAFHATTYAHRLRTWDYGLDPAPRTDTPINPVAQGTTNQTIQGHAPAFIVALRTQPVGSAIVNRLNGRLFHPFLPTGQISGTNPDVYVKNIYEALRNTYLNPAGDANRGVWCVVSWRNAGAVRPVPVVTPVDHLIVGRWGTQRRRNAHLPGYGRGA